VAFAVLLGGSASRVRVAVPVLVDEREIRVVLDMLKAIFERRQVYVMRDACRSISEENL
jgi:hypothetical protein